MTTRMQAAASTALQKLTITNPKRDPKNVSGRAAWYPYYAGFSPVFARSFFDSLALNPGSEFFDETKINKNKNDFPIYLHRDRECIGLRSAAGLRWRDSERCE